MHSTAPDLDSPAWAARAVRRTSPGPGPELRQPDRLGEVVVGAMVETDARSSPALRVDEIMMAPV